MMTIEELTNAILDGEVDLTGLPTSADVEAISAYIQERNRQLAEYCKPSENYQESEAYREKHEEASKTVIKEAHVGVGNLIDSAFVIEVESEKADDDEEELCFVTEYKATPEEGEHLVRLREYPEKREGRGENGDYRIFSLINKEGKCWTCIVSEEEILKTAQEIDYENNACITRSNLEHLTKKAVLSLLGRTWFRCWTAQLNSGKTKTYFSQNRFSKFLYAREKNREKNQLATPEIEKAKTWEF